MKFIVFGAVLSAFVGSVTGKDENLRYGIFYVIDLLQL